MQVQLWESSVRAYALDTVDQRVDSRFSIVFRRSIKNRDSQDDRGGIGALHRHFSVVLALSYNDVSNLLINAF